MLVSRKEPTSRRRATTNDWRRPAGRLAFWSLCCAVSLCLAAGQTVPSKPAQPPATGEANRNSGSGSATTTQKTPAQKPQDDRLFYLLPNYLTLENAKNAPPLTAGQKFKITARDTFDPVEFAWYGLQAGISQAEDTDAVYGQGVEGYAKRYGVRFADGTIQNFFTKAIFPSMLHQDPRYFQMGKGGFWKRTLYAVSRIAVIRSDAGTEQFNYSEVLGSGAAAAISAFTYHPDYAHNLSSVLDVWGTQVGYDALSYTLKEFWPDIRRRLHHSKSAAQP